MNTTKLVTTLFAAALIAVPAAALAGQGKQQGGNKHPPPQRAQVERGQQDMGADRLRQQDRAGVAQHDRDRIQDRTHAPDGMQQDANNIYGYDLMSDKERNAYRERIQNAENRQEREQIEAQHRHEMQVRAANQGVQIEEPKKTRKGKDDS